MPETKKITQSRVGRFGALGVINTALDFIILNLLRVITHTTSNNVNRLIVLNLISASTVSIFSFFMNRKYVFKSEASHKKVIPFVAITLFGIFALQSLAIKFSTPLIQPIAERAHDFFLSSSIPIIKNFSVNFYDTNGAKFIATIVGMFWNYLMYREFVFKDTKLVQLESIEQESKTITDRKA